MHQDIMPCYVVDISLYINIGVQSVFFLILLGNLHWPRRDKTCLFGVSDKVRFKPVCSAKETS